MVVEKLDMSQQCVLLAQKDSSVLGCIKTSMINSSREAILPVYFSHRRPYQEYYVQLSDSQHKNNMDLWEQVQRRAISMI